MPARCPNSHPQGAPFGCYTRGETEAAVDRAAGRTQDTFWGPPHEQHAGRQLTVTTAHIDIGRLVDRRPDIRGGRPCLAGTGVTVQRIVGWYHLGLDPEEIADRIGHLSLAQVHAALAYYHANREEIERAMAEDQVAGDQAETHHARPRESQE